MFFPILQPLQPISFHSFGALDVVKQTLKQSLMYDIRSYRSTITLGTKTIAFICTSAGHTQLKIRKNCRSGEGSNQISSTVLHTLSLSYKCGVSRLQNASRFPDPREAKKKKKKKKGTFIKKNKQTKQTKTNKQTKRQTNKTIGKKWMAFGDREIVEIGFDLFKEGSLRVVKTGPRWPSIPVSNFQ